MYFGLCLGQREMWLETGVQAKVKLPLIKNMMYLLTKQAYNQGWIAIKLIRRAKAECQFYKPAKNNLG